MKGFAQRGYAHTRPRVPSHYAIVDRHTEARGTFSAAEDVARFLWGRDLARYHVARNGVWVTPAGTTVADITRSITR